MDAPAVALGHMQGKDRQRGQDLRVLSALCWAALCFVIPWIFVEGAQIEIAASTAGSGDG